MRPKLTLAQFIELAVVVTYGVFMYAYEEVRWWVLGLFKKGL